MSAQSNLQSSGVSVPETPAISLDRNGDGVAPQSAVSTNGATTPIEPQPSMADQPPEGVNEDPVAHLDDQSGDVQEALAASESLNNQPLEESGGDGVSPSTQQSQVRVHPSEITGVQQPTSAPASSIVEVLVNKGYLKQGDHESLQSQSIQTGKSLDELIEESNFVTHDQYIEAKAEFFNIPFVRPNELGVSPEALNVVAEPVSSRYQLLPFHLDKTAGVLSVAMANPLDLQAIDFVEKKTGYSVKPHFALGTDLSQTIAERYSQSLSSEVTEALKDTTAERRKVVDVTQLGEVIREAPIAKIVETILTYAVKSRASDVHIEAQNDKTRIRYRIDGILHEKLVLPKGVHDAVVSRIKILADLKIDERRLPQDGRFAFRYNEQEVDLRVSTLPTVNGEKVVMRLLQKTVKVPTLSDLGLRGLALKNLQSAIVVPHGIVLITGPTGSGKTTTLFAILHQINSPKVNIVTLEDPVEYEIPGVNQVQINPKAGLTFASGLRSFLRQDPNIIEVGEIRDTETADLAIQASLTGHLVFSTLHTNSAAGALPRLMDMEVEPFLLASSMTCVVGQRVVRKICEHCKTPFEPEQAVVHDMKEVLGNLFTSWLQQHNMKEEDLKLHKGQGCKECNDTGYIGRIAIFEVLPVSEKISKLITERKPAIEIEKQAIEDGMILMKMDGYLKVMDGTTTIEEVLRVAEV